METSIQHRKLIQVMKEHITEAIKPLDQKIDNYIKEDTAWKERAEPMLRVYENSTWAYKAFIGLLKFVAAIGSAVGAVVVIKKWLA